MRQKQLGRSVGDVELPPSSLVQKRVHESILNVTLQDQPVEGCSQLNKKMRQKQLGRSVGHVELPPSSLVQEEGHESMLNITLQDQPVEGSPCTTLPEVLEDQNQMRIEVENQDSTPKVAEKKKHRGPTLMVKVHQRTFREEIALNAKGQPIGPPSAVVELAGFLGTIAKDPTLAPINILDWKCMHTKDDIWNYVKEKFKISEEGKKYVLQTVNDDWRVYKSRLKKKHYKAYETDEERWNNRPATIPENQFRELLDYWDSSVGKEIARVNATNRQKHEDVHTLGPHSIARLRHELEQKNANKQPPSDSVVYKLSRKRDPTHAYKTNGCKSKEYIDKMNNIQQQIERGEKGKDVDPYSEVIAKELNGRAFLQGRGLKTSTLKGKEKKGSYLLDKEFFQKMKEDWAEELIPTLTSKILSQMKVAYPHLDFSMPNLTSTPEFSDQVVRNMRNNAEPQDKDVQDKDMGDEDEDVEEEDVEAIN